MWGTPYFIWGLWNWSKDIYLAYIYQQTLMNKQLFKKAPRERRCKQTEKQVWSLWRHAEYDFYSKF